MIDQYKKTKMFRYMYMGATFNPISRTLSNVSRAVGRERFVPALLDLPNSLRKTKKMIF